MELQLLAVEMASAPTSTDNNTVILWVVGILMLGMSLLLAALNSKVVKNEVKCSDEAKRCEEERKKYQETASGHHKKVEAIYQTIIADKEEASKTRAQLLAETADALQRNTEVFNRLITKGNL